jgi:hypothetical protein
MYAAEVWTGSHWLVLGIYQREGNARRRVERSRSQQEHRVRPISAAYAEQCRQNLDLRTTGEVRELRVRY